MPPSLFHLNMNIKDPERDLSLFLSSFYLGLTLLNVRYQGFIT